MQYLIKRKGNAEPTWEKEENCNNCLELLAEFAQREATKQNAHANQPQLSERVLTNVFGKFTKSNQKKLPKFTKIHVNKLFKCLGITDAGGHGLVFLTKFQDKQENELLSWHDMREYFPRDAMDFFKSRIHWPEETQE